MSVMTVFHGVLASYLGLVHQRGKRSGRGRERGERGVRGDAERGKERQGEEGDGEGPSEEEGICDRVRIWGGCACSACMRCMYRAKLYTFALHIHDTLHIVHDTLFIVQYTHLGSVRA